MRLRNKKTGQEGNFIINKDHFECVDLDYVPEYRNIAELTEEWEDYEEPEGWCVTMYGGISRITKDEILVPDLKEIGNYFNDKESAYDALDKLKAWKRLKDKGFGFESWFGGSKDISFWIDAEIDEDIAKDLDLLFGGEDE